MTDPVAQVLRDAADLIERDGWCQGDSLNDAGERCVAGAIYDTKAGRLVADAIVHLGDFVHSPGAVATWNDVPGRTVTEVLAALRACADEQEASDG